LGGGRLPVPPFDGEHLSQLAGIDQPADRLRPPGLAVAMADGDRGPEILEAARLLAGDAGGLVADDVAEAGLFTFEQVARVESVGVGDEEDGQRAPVCETREGLIAAELPGRTKLEARMQQVQDGETPRHGLSGHSAADDEGLDFHEAERTASSAFPSRKEP